MSIKKPTPLDSFASNGVNKIEKFTPLDKASYGYLTGLIDELCPDGVEFRALGKVCEKTSNIKWQNNKSKQFQYIDLSSVDRNRNIITETQVITSETAPSRAQKIVRLGDVIFGTTRPTLKRFCVINHGYNEQICSTGFCVLRPKSETVLTNYIFHIISSSDFYSYTESNQKGASYPAISDNMVKKFKIPIPPLTIQKEIVKILDNFTQLEAELEAELEARKKQYEHYREELLTFGDDVEFRALGEVADYVDYRGKTPKKTADGIFLVTAKNIRKGYIDYNTSQEFISENDYNLVMRRGFPEIGDVLITTEAPCGFVAQVDRENIALAQRVIKYRSKNELLLNSFLKYYLLGSQFQKKLDKTATGSTVKGIKGSKLHKLTIPIPPLAEQKRIVAILDKFDALVNDISVGLPAEISARKKQYGYYRNQLLTFTPLDNFASNGEKEKSFAY